MNYKSMGYQVQTIPEQGKYLSSTSELSTAIDDWLSKTPDITIMSINTVFSPAPDNFGYAAIINYSAKIKEADQRDAIAC